MCQWCHAVTLLNSGNWKQQYQSKTAKLKVKQQQVEIYAKKGDWDGFISGMY